MGKAIDRFTQRARRVLLLAQDEAERLQHSAIESEHLLLGLMWEGGGIAARALDDLGVPRDVVQELVQRMTHTGQSEAEKRECSPESKKTLYLAFDEARRMGNHYIGTEHLLLALLYQTDSVAIAVLKRLNISPEEVRRQVQRLLSEKQQ